MIRKFVVGLIIFILLLVASVGAAFSYQRTTKNTQGAIPAPTAKIMHYLDPNVDLSHILIWVFYVVPQDHKDQIYPEWHQVIGQTMDDGASFHTSQFKNQSELTYRLYPEPIIGQETAASYAQDDTPTDPKSLGRIIKELDQRILQASGDLYTAEYSAVPSGTYTMKLIIYETDSPRFIQVSQTGEIGGYSDQNMALVSREILTDLPNKPYGPSIVYHEIGHMMGLPEGYDYRTNQPNTNDIMGSGRSRPIQNNYLNPEVLKKLGVR